MEVPGVLFSSSSKNKKKIHPEKIFSYISGNENPKKTSNTFSEENPVKILYISGPGNETFLYFRKGILRTLAYLEQESYLGAEYMEIFNSG